MESLERAQKGILSNSLHITREFEMKNPQLRPDDMTNMRSIERLPTKTVRDVQALQRCNFHGGEAHHTIAARGLRVMLE